MICTSIEQSKHLLELGLSPDSADMEYCYIDEFNSGLQVKCDINVEVDRKLDMMFGVTHIPAWSLSALLDVIPKECEPDIQKSPISGVYFAHWFADGKPYITDDHGNAVAAAYEMVCWLLENNLIVKGGQDE